MKEDKIGNLLEEADRRAGPPTRVDVSLSALRRRAERRRPMSLAGPLAAAAVILIAAGLWNALNRTAEKTQENQQIASRESQVKQLQARTDAALNLIQEVLAEERRQTRLNELQAQLAAIADPLEEARRNLDKTAFILVYQADRMYRELNQTDSAVKAYNRVIELFPDNRWAAVARQRLSEIEERRI